MQVGVVSDTHDDMVNVKKIIRIFKNEKIENVIHLGDYVAPPLVKLFAGFNLTGILGNNDGYQLGLIRTFEEIGGKMLGAFGEINIDNIKIALYHGEFREISEALALSGKYDIVLCGHFHKAENTLFKNTLLLSPGSAHYYFTNDSSPTFGILNTLYKSFEIISI